MTHVLAKNLRQAVLQAAFEGRLTAQNENDTPLRILSQTIKENKEKAIKNKTIKKTKQLPKIIEGMEPIEIPERWDYCYIDDIAFVTKLAGFEYSKYIAESVTTSGIPLFKGKNVQNGKLVLNFESYIPESVSDQLNRSQLRKKCLLTPYVGTIGNIAIFDGSFRAHLGSNVGKIEILNDEKEIMLEEYLLYYLRSSYGYNELSKYKKATAQESISIDAIRNVIVPLCSPEEQARIVARVDELMAKIDEYEKLENELVELKKNFPRDMKAAVLQAAMQGKLTEQKSTELISKVKKEAISEEYDTFDIPDNWQWNTIDSVMSVTTGLTFNKPDQRPAGLNTLRVLRGGNILDNFNYGLFDNDVYVTYRDKHIPLLKGDVITPAVTSMEKMCKVGYIEKDLLNITAGGFVYILRTKDTDVLDPRYMMYFFNSAFNRNNCNVNIHKSGQAFYNLKKSGMVTQPIPLPPIEEQRRIVEKLDKILPLCEELEKEIA